ncbi:MBL fold metallo-hydrolase [Yinghuangia seranimata]|uniref:MBL fold metallo-hydrolase n=1 Tax=Yinghuangia seranimata TaxID=408067 RepID=UPI00248BA5C9|nr:MBL fold metallo-hydrolase [Yinghuangia seranimata]MDI2131011.1 MBL fold metallo-hydrolase [Yinghuangia seranimata]
MSVEHVVTSGVFSLDGQDFDVDNNVWLIGDDREVVVVDAAHDAAAIAAAVGDRGLVGIVCTHGHNDHVNAAAELADRYGAPVHLHPEDRMLWDVVHPDRAPDRSLADGQALKVAGLELRVVHTPGHAPGAVCLYVPELDVLFSGDTLFRGGPGATGRSFSSFPVILDSIRDRLLTLPAGTRVLTGHGDETTIGAEAADYDAWVARGH